MVTLTDRWTHAKLAKRPSRAGFVSLFLACLDSACHAAAVSAVLTTPNLGPLVLDSLSRDPHSGSSGSMHEAWCMLCSTQV